MPEFAKILYYDPEWIPADPAQEIGLPEYAQQEIADRRHLLDQARELGMVTAIRTHDEYETKDLDGFVVRGPLMRYDEEIALARQALPEVRIPQTVDFVTFTQEPFFPAVAKHHGAQRGEHKFLLECPEQWQKLSGMLTGTGKLLHHWPYPFRGYDFTRLLEYQQFVRTPSEHYTSFRTVVSAAGHILASSLYYSEETDKDTRPIAIHTPVERLGQVGESVLDLVMHPSSLAYIAARSFQSNNSRGGHGIVLDPTPRSKPASAYDKHILVAHDIDPERPRLPERLRQAAAVIGKTVGRRMDIVTGIDWLMDAQDGGFYYLESNAGPGPMAYRDAHFGDDPALSLEAAHDHMYTAALRSLAAS